MCAHGHTVWPPGAGVFFPVCGPLPSRTPSPISLRSWDRRTCYRRWTARESDVQKEVRWGRFFLLNSAPLGRCLEKSSLGRGAIKEAASDLPMPVSGTIPGTRVPSAPPGPVPAT